MLNSSGERKRRISSLALSEWVSFLLSQKQNVDQSASHTRNMILLLVGLIGALLLWIMSFGLTSLATFLLLSVFPLAVFFVLLLKGRYGKVFWMLEAALFTLGICGLVAGLISSISHSGGENEIGLMYLVAYFTFLLLVIAALYLSWGMAMARIVSHNLDQLSVAIAMGGVSDIDRIMRRFRTIMQSWWAGERFLVVQVGRLLGLRTGRRPDEYEDDVVYQWMIETYGGIAFESWLENNRERLEALFPDGLKGAEGAKKR